MNDRGVCEGVTGVGPCVNGAKYTVDPTLEDPADRTPRWMFACGVHLAQIVKFLLRSHPSVDVERWPN